MAPIKSTVMSRRDLEFLLFEWLAVDELTKRSRFAEHSRETFADVLDLCEDLATRYFAPHNKKSDANEPTFDGTTVTLIPEVKQAWDALADAGILTMTMDAELGGAQLPAAVGQAGFAWFEAANVATSGYVMLTMANANLLTTFGSVGDDGESSDGGGDIGIPTTDGSSDGGSSSQGSDGSSSGGVPAEGLDACLRTDNPDVGSAEEDVDYTVGDDSGATSDFKFGISLRYLGEALEHVATSSAKLCFDGVLDPMLLHGVGDGSSRDGGDVFVIMPNHVHVLLHFMIMPKSLNKVIGEGKRFMAKKIIMKLRNFS